jgi:hypothetical protein
MSDRYALKRGGWAVFGDQKKPKKLRAILVRLDSVPVEIRAGAIQPDPRNQGCFLIDAITAAGQRKFRSAVEITGTDAQSDTGSFFPQLIGEFYTVYDLPVALRPEYYAESKSRHYELMEVEEPEQSEASEDDASTLLAKLKQAHSRHLSFRDLIIEAEAINLSVEQETELAVILREFIESRRDSNDPDDVVAVGSAMRKYVACIGINDLEGLLPLLESGHKARPSTALVLELVKMVARKYAANPPAKDDPCPTLAKSLAKIATPYLNAYVLPHDKFAAIALNATMALVGMMSDQLDSIIEVVNQLPYAWFKIQLQRRIEELKSTWAARPFQERIERLSARLDEIAGKIKV